MSDRFGDVAVHEVVLTPDRRIVVITDCDDHPMEKATSGSATARRISGRCRAY
ncbi:hypothetical protein [Halogranum rubrum]|uniref:Uncharacterized protein n=1 Tax=Halogranum salarium B-1 TaxID=1210908 RepID=J3EZQ1_9EURY|nr:hypothetical protein [Halogranum salarium]EJN61127.1 hypothetical protein HSB1_01680 [Halogranum salarium B-1]